MAALSLPRRFTVPRHVATLLRGTAVLGCIALVVAHLDFARVGSALAGCDWRLVIAGGVVHLCSSVLKALTWQCLVDGLPSARGRSRSTDLVPALFVGAFVNTALIGRAGEVAKILVARRRLADRGAPVDLLTLAGTVASEHVIACVGWMLVVLAVAAGGGVPIAATAAAAVIGGSCLAIVVGTSRLPGRADRPGRIARACAGLTASHHALREPRRASAVLALAVLQWVAQVLAILLVLHAAGLGRVGLAGAAAVMVALTIAHAVPIVPGNIGVFQAAATIPLAATWGVSSSVAVGFGVALQLAEMAVGLVVGAAFALRVGWGRTAHPRPFGQEHPMVLGAPPQPS